METTEYVAYEVRNDDGEHSLQTYAELGSDDESIVGVVKLKYSDATCFKGGTDYERCKVGDIVAVNGTAHQWSEVTEIIK